MSIIASFLVPSSPLTYFRSDNPPWQPTAEALQEAGRRIAEMNPDVLLVYSTTWQAVMDQLWQARKLQQGTHVDHNWFELGELSYDFQIDTELAQSCVTAATDSGIKSKPVDYDQFPIDTGTIVAMHFLNPNGKIPVVLASNNLYHDHATVAELGKVASSCATQQNKRAVAITIGELSGSFFRNEINITEDSIFKKSEDDWNRRMLDHLTKGDLKTCEKEMADYNAEARAEYGFKHLQFLLGAMGGSYHQCELLAYGPLYGKGGAVMQFTPE